MNEPLDYRLTEKERDMLKRLHEQGILKEANAMDALEGFLTQPADVRDLTRHLIHYLAGKGKLDREESVQLERQFMSVIEQAPHAGRQHDTIPLLSPLTTSQESDLPVEAAAASRTLENQLGKYVRVSRLGAGGMGEVWKGWDTELRRWVALKFLKNENHTEIARFKREAQTAAKLNHPNIAAVYDVGEHDGHHFIVMQYVDGPTLQSFPRNDHKLLAELVRDAALAVHAAHERGIVHRDLKPANLMVEGRQTKTKIARPGSGHLKAQDLRVYVMDFGLAKQITTRASFSLSGYIVGTPEYLSPEQARGKTREVNAQSDVYSLGATLYDLLTGTPPFRHPDVYEVIKKVIEEDPLPARKINPRVDADIDTIVMKCLEKNQKRRYRTALELAEELTRYIEGDAILAHPPSVGYRVGKAISRRKAIVGMVGVGLATAGAVAGFAVPAWLRAQKEKQDAQAALAALQRDEQKLWLAQQYLNEMNLEKAIAVSNELIQEGKSLIDAYYIRGSAKYLQFNSEAIDDLVLADKKSMELKQVRDYRALWDAAMACLDIEVENSVHKAVQFSKLALEKASRDASHPQRPFFLLHQSLIAFFEKQYKEAIDYAEEALSLSPYKTKAMYLLSMYHSEGIVTSFNARGLRPFRDYQKALAHIEDALRIEPRHIRYLVQSARLNVTLNNTERALAQADQLIQMKPHPEFFYYKAYALNNSGRLQECLLQLELAERHGKLTSLHLALRGTAHYNLKQFEDAVGTLDASIRLKPNSPAYAYRGLALGALGKLEAAISDFSTALELNNENNTAYFGRGIAHEHQKRFDDALSDYDNAGTYGQPRGFLLGGKLCVKLGKEAEAAQRFNAYLKTKATEGRAEVERWLREYEQ